MIVNDFQEIMEKYDAETRKPWSKNKFASKMRKEFKIDLNNFISSFHKNFDENYVVSFSKNNRWIYTPWYGIFNNKITKSAQDGYYIVFLFKPDMSGVYLSLNFGTTEFKNNYEDDDNITLKKAADNFRNILKEEFDFIYTPMDLGMASDGKHGKYDRDYEEGDVFNIFYPIDEMPSDKKLNKDLSLFLSMYEYLIDKRGKEIFTEDELINIKSISYADEFKYPKLDLTTESVKSKFTDFKINENIIKHTLAALNAGKHVIITGTPGTGKTEVAVKFSKVASDNKFIDGHVLTTATSDWSTFDTIGGLMPKEDGTLEFIPGKFLEAIEKNKWLIIDEINRADIDKAFGQLFTVLSGQDVELPYKQNGLSIKIKNWDENFCKYDGKTATYYIGENWRIIGTMNVDDKDSLFDLSYAFMRRFMFIEVDLPSPEDYKKIIEMWANDLDEEYSRKLIQIYDIVQYRKLGPAIFKDMISYIKERNKLESPDYNIVLGEAVDSYILPQLEGLNRNVIEDIENLFDEIGLLAYIYDKFDELKLDL